MQLKVICGTSSYDYGTDALDGEREGWSDSQVWHRQKSSSNPHCPLGIIPFQAEVT